LNAKPQRRDEALSAYSKGPASTIGRGENKNQQEVLNKAETQSRAQSSYFKKRILDKINQMDDNDLLQRIGHDLNIEEGKDADKASVITTDKLRKFNEIYGFDNGPAVEGDG
jgi:hypothetical protein